MKKINFELIFKIIVLIQLTIILLLLLFPSNDNYKIYNEIYELNQTGRRLIESNQNGRYKDVRTMYYGWGNKEEGKEVIRILDTQTGKFQDK